MEFVSKIHKLMAITIVCALLLQTFSKNIIISSYYINTSNYLKACINKAKPQLKCNGKCQMSKKLLEDSDEESTQNSNNIKLKLLDLSSKSFFATVPIFVALKQKATKFLFKNDNRLFQIPIDIFHPPQTKSIC